MDPSPRLTIDEIQDDMTRLSIQDSYPNEICPFQKLLDHVYVLVRR